MEADENKENPTQVNTSSEIIEPALGDDLLQILGTEPEQNTKTGPPLHTAIASRWSALIKNGLDSVTKEEILKKYQVPENLSDLDIPQLNPEVSAAISAQVARRDERLIQKQNQLNSTISAIGQAISFLLVKEGEGQKCIELLSDAGRLLCDLSHSETTIRRDLISINLNKDLKQTLSGAPVDKYLFGVTLEERLKTAKNLEKSSLDLKPTKPQTTKKHLQPLNSKRPIRTAKGARIGTQYRSSPYQRPTATPYRDPHQFKKPQETVREARRTKVYAHRYHQKQ